MEGGDGQPKSWGFCVRCRSKCSHRSVVAFPHQDGQVRVVQVSIRGQKLIHPITRLCPLNVADQPSPKERSWAPCKRQVIPLRRGPQLVKVPWAHGKLALCVLVRTGLWNRISHAWENPSGEFHTAMYVSRFPQVYHTFQGLYLPLLRWWHIQQFLEFMLFFKACNVYGSASRTMPENASAK